MRRPDSLRAALWLSALCCGTLLAAWGDGAGAGAVDNVAGTRFVTQDSQDIPPLRPLSRLERILRSSPQQPPQRSPRQSPPQPPQPQPPPKPPQQPPQPPQPPQQPPQPPQPPQQPPKPPQQPPQPPQQPPQPPQPPQQPAKPPQQPPQPPQPPQQPPKPPTQWPQSRSLPGQGGASRCGRTIESTRIYNGLPAKRGEYPWQAALLYRKGAEAESANCGGALISARFVLTAAHCVDPQAIEGWRLSRVMLGALEWGRPGPEAEIHVPDRVTAHPLYKSLAGAVRNENDIALLRLPRPAAYTETIRPVCLPPTHDLPSRFTQARKLTVAGWGETENRTGSAWLMAARVPLVESALCGQNLSTAITANQLCAGGGAQDSCVGDSGGPLLRANKYPGSKMVYEVVGVVSYGYNICATKGKPGVYTRVAPYVAWIDQTMKQQA